MEIQRKYLFFLAKEINKPDAKLRFRIRYDKKVVHFDVGYRVNIIKWDATIQRCKAGTTHGKKKTPASVINRELQRLEDLADNVFKSFEVKEFIPEVDLFRDAFNAANGKTGTHEETKTFFSIFDEFVLIEGKEKDWSEATFKKFHTIRKHLYAYNPKLDLNTISETDMRGLVSYMQKTGLRNTTIAKDINIIKWFIRWTTKKKYYTGDLLNTWEPKFKGTDGNQKEIIYLTWKELTHLYGLKVPKSKQYLTRVRDVFCFQCFTSLRYSDVANLRRSDVKGNYISVVTQKTVDGLKIELNDYSSEILDKYKDIHFPGDKALPVISNVKMNAYLKELGELAGLNEPQRVVYFMGNERIEEVYPKYELLTTHCGRRTFVVNALYLGIPAEVVMRWTGHSDFKAMKPYMKIVDELKEKEMKKFNKK